MKLWILLDEKVNGLDINDNDIIFVSSGNLDDIYQKNKCKVIFFEKHLSYGDKIASDAVKNLMNDFSDEMRIYSNTLYYKLFRPIANCIYQLNSLLNENNFESVVLVGGSKNIFISCVYAEGEGEKSFYHTSWFINSIIYDYIKKNYNIPIVWKKRRNKIYDAVINVLRENCILIKGCISEIIKWFKYRKYSKNNINENTNTVIVCESITQYRFLKKIIKHRNIDNYVFLCYPYVNLKMEGENNYSFLKILNPFFTIWLMFKIYAQSKQQIIRFSFLNMEFKIDSKKIFRALYREQLFSLLWRKSISKFLRDYPSIELIISDMAVGTDISSTYTIAKEHKVKFINYQYVSMDAELYPNLDMADEYYLYSQKVYKLYSPISYSYKRYFPVFGKFNNNRNDITMVLFLQPDDFVEDYKRILFLLLPVIENNDNVQRLVIKPHYRQKYFEDFKEITKPYHKAQISLPSDDTQKLLMKCDLMLSICSSVLSEAVFYCTPGVIVDIAGKYNDFIYSNDSCMSDINFYADSIDVIKTIINNFEKAQTEYKEKWKKYVIDKS